MILRLFSMLAELCNRYHNYRTFLSPQRETTRGHSSLQPPAPTTHFLCLWTCLLWTFRTMESCNLWPFVSGFSCRGSHCKVVHAAAASELFLHSGTRCSVPRCFLTCPWRTCGSLSPLLICMVPRPHASILSELCVCPAHTGTQVPRQWCPTGQASVTGPLLLHSWPVSQRTSPWPPPVSR